MDGEYTLTGEFIETCDCAVICPCWVDEAPDEGHCTGLLAWRIGPGSVIDGVSVAGRTVVSVTAHGGSRRGGDSATVLFVDDEATAEQRDLLADAFAGDAQGPLADLADVTGVVLLRQPAAIAVTETPGSGWQVTVRIGADTEAADLVHASGTAKHLDDDADPLTVSHTALDTELGIGSGSVVAQQGEALRLAIPALPAGYLDVTGRSGMRGSFHYRYRPDDDDDD